MAKPSTRLAVQLFMVRLGKSFACAVLAATGLLMPGRQASAQTTAPPATQPQATLPPHTPQPATTSPVKAKARHKKAAPEAEATPTPPAPPPPPRTLEQSPPTPPRVSFQNGELTIDAANSTLSQVLRAVQLRTGASIEMPAGAGSDRVVAQLGPGQPRDVLTTLLNGSKFDYVILGVSGDPGAVQKVILTLRQGGAPGSEHSAQNVQPGAPPTSEDEGQAEEAAPDTAENEYQNPEQPAPPPGGFRRPGIPGGQPGDPGAAFGNGEQQNGAKSPEQLMQELQQMQQQQQQYQQQLNPANREPPQ